MQDSLSPFTVASESTLIEAAKVIESNAARTALVMNDKDDGKAIGIISEGDILRALLKGADIHAPVTEHMHVNFRYLETMDHAKAKALFAEHGFGMIPVLDRTMHLTGVITLIDCLRQSR